MVSYRQKYTLGSYLVMLQDAKYLFVQEIK